MPSKRDRRNRLVAIWIILSLILSLLVGALSMTPTPVNAAPASVTSDKVYASFDSDGDGIENNLDTDIDGDGILNFNDSDIDGDGVANFEDGDPAQTNGFDSEKPSRPGSVEVLGVQFESLAGVIWVGVMIGGGIFLTLGLRLLEKSRKNRKKTF